MRPPYCHTDTNGCYGQHFPRRAAKTEDFGMGCISLCLVDVEFRTIEALKKYVKQIAQFELHFQFGQPKVGTFVFIALI